VKPAFSTVIFAGRRAGRFRIDHEFAGPGAQLDGAAVHAESGEVAAGVESGGDPAVGEGAALDGDGRHAAHDRVGDADAGERWQVEHASTHDAAAREREGVEEAGFTGVERVGPNALGLGLSFQTRWGQRVPPQG
jgi:hypothetical protein